MSRIRFPDPALVLYSAPRGFSPGIPVFPFLKNQHFQIPLNSILECTDISERVHVNSLVLRVYKQITYIYIHLFLQLLTIFAKFNARLAELFDDFYLAYSEKHSHEDQWNNQNWSNKHPQEEHEIMPTKELPR